MFSRIIFPLCLVLFSCFSLPAQAYVSNWATDQVGRTLDRPSIINFKGNLFQLVRGEDDRVYTRCVCYDQGVAVITPWLRTQEQLDFKTTLQPVTAIEFQQKLYEVALNQDGKLYSRMIASQDDISMWNQDTTGFTFANQPTITIWNDRLFEAGAGLDGKIYSRFSNDGVNWSQWTSYGIGTTQKAVAMIVFNGQLYQSVKGSNDTFIYTRTSVDGVTWSNWQKDILSETKDAVDFSVVRYYTDNGDVLTSWLYEVARSSSGLVYVRWNEGKEWGTWATVESLTQASTSLFGLSTPSATTKRFPDEKFDTLVIISRALNNSIHWIFVKPR